MADITREDIDKLINDAMKEINTEKEKDENEVVDINVNEVEDNKDDVSDTPVEEIKEEVKETPDVPETGDVSNKEPFEFLGATITINDDGTKATITKDDVTKEVDIKSTDLKDVFETVENFFADFVKEEKVDDVPTNDVADNEKDDVLSDVTSDDDLSDSDIQNDDELNELERKLNDEDFDDEEDEKDMASVSASNILASSMNELYSRYSDKIEGLIELGLETKNAVLSSISDITQKKPISVLSSKIDSLKTEKETNSKKEVSVTKKYLLAKKVNKNVHNALDTIVASLKTINNNTNSFSPAQMDNEIKNVKILAEQFVNSKTPETILASCISIENNNKSLNNKLDEYKKQKDVVVAKRIEKNKVNNVVSNKIVHENLDRTVLNDDRYDGMEEMLNSLKNLIA